MSVALVLSAVSLVVALGSLWWARDSARSTKRSADAQEAAAQAATATLELQRETATSARRDREARDAPILELVSRVTAQLPGGAGSVVGAVTNTGPGTVALVESATLHYPGGSAPAKFGTVPPIRLARDETLPLSFASSALDAIGWADQRLEIDLVYRVDGSAYRGGVRFELLRDGGDHAGRPLWRIGETRITRLDS